MTLEDDNKTAEEAATTTTGGSSTTSSTASSVPAPDSGSVSPNGLVPTDEATILSTTTELDDDLKSAAIKQKRSFDEISQSSISSIPNPLTSSESLLASSCDQDVVSSTTTTNGTTTTTAITSEETVPEPEEPVEEMTVEQPEEIVEPEQSKAEQILATFKVVYAKTPYEVTMDLNGTVAELKAELQEQTGVTKSMQKLCFRGNLDDQKTLKDSGIKEGVKILLIGSKTDDIQALNDNKPEASKAAAAKEKPSKEPLCQQKQHKKIIDKGLPEFATLGWINEDCSLPAEPLTGMVNKYGNKVRLTFKFEADEVWIGTKEHTQKLAMTNVKSVISEPIDNHPQYHLMGLQVGPTEASRLWFYWVPAQYVRAIKRAILNE